MSRPGRFLFDECVGKPVMEQLRALVAPDDEFVHITDLLGQGWADDEWIPKLAAEGGWVVITSDGGKHSKRGHKLPDLCRASGVTHVVMSAKLHEKKSAEKSAALAPIRADIAATASAPAGTRYRLRIKQMRSISARVTVLLEPVDPPAATALPRPPGAETPPPPLESTEPPAE